MILSYKKEDGTTAMFRLRPVSVSKPITIGREQADIKLNDARVSRIHAAIRYWDDIFVIRDMNSRNGVLLNSQKVEVARLNPGDIIQIGDTEIRCMAEEGSHTDVTICG